MLNLKKIRTCDLIKELKSREGIETYSAAPEENTEITVEGPAVVLVVTD